MAEAWNLFEHVKGGTDPNPFRVGEGRVRARRGPGEGRARPGEDRARNRRGRARTRECRGVKGQGRKTLMFVGCESVRRAK